MRPDEIRALAEQAHNEVTALCAGPHRPGGKRWRMSVPVRRDDSDILFSNLAAEAEHLAGYVEQVLALDPRAHDDCGCDLSNGWRQTIRLVQSLLQGPRRPSGSVAVEQHPDGGLRGVPIPSGECEVAAGYRAPGTCCAPDTDPPAEGCTGSTVASGDSGADR